MPEAQKKQSSKPKQTAKKRSSVISPNRLEQRLARLEKELAQQATRLPKAPVRRDVTKPTQDKRLEARIDDTLEEMIHQAAAASGKKVSEFVRASLHAAAEKALMDARILKLAREDQMTFARALINPPAPSEALVDVFDKHHTLIEK